MSSTLIDLAKSILHSIDEESKKYRPQYAVGWVVQDYILYDSHDKETVKYFHDDEEVPYVGEPEKIADEIISWDHGYKSRSWSDDERSELIEKIEDEGLGCEYKYENLNQFFFTKGAAEDFLKSNYYHYHDNARVVCNHQWRNYEISDIIAILRDYCKN